MFILVVEVTSGDLNNIELGLQRYFTVQCLHVVRGGGTEFFKKDIEKLIVPWLHNSGLYYNVLSDELNGTVREQNTLIQFTDNNYNYAVFDEIQDNNYNRG